MNRLYLFLVALLGLVFLAAACGSDDADTDAGATTGDTTDAPIDDSGADDPAADPDDDTTNDDGAAEPASDEETPLGGAPINAGDGPIGSVRVTITHPDHGDVVYEIGCFGDTFPVTPPVDGIDGGAACAQLGDPDVLTRLVDGPPADQVCTEQYGGPDVATITGEIDGQAVDATIDRTDGCGIDDWDSVLSDILPPPQPFDG